LGKEKLKYLSQKGRKKRGGEGGGGKYTTSLSREPLLSQKRLYRHIYSGKNTPEGWTKRRRYYSITLNKEACVNKLKKGKAGIV